MNMGEPRFGMNSTRVIWHGLTENRLEEKLGQVCMLVFKTRSPAWKTCSYPLNAPPIAKI